MWVFGTDFLILNQSLKKFRLFLWYSKQRLVSLVHFVLRRNVKDFVTNGSHELSAITELGVIGNSEQVKSEIYINC